MSAVATTIEQARMAAKTLSPPPIDNVADDVTNLAKTVSSQMNVVTPFGSLLGKVEILVKVGDEVAKVCPVLSSSSSQCPKTVADPSLCQFCVASTLRGAEGKSGSILAVFSIHRYPFNRWSKRNKSETRGS
jgi:hypothetical protein